VDGPTILWLLLQICNPSTRVGVAELKEDLRRTTSEKFQRNVKNMTDHLSSKFRNIREKGQTHEDYLPDVFNALATVPNPDFAAHVRDGRREWELGGLKTADEIISEAVTIYNNAVSANRWDTSDPKDAKIVALATRIDELVEQQTKLAALATSNSQNRTRKNGSRRFNSDNNNFKINPIEDWRMKQTDPKIERDGKTWWWCPRHVQPGKYNGLYVTHKPEDHDDWVQKKEARRARFAKENSKEDKPSTSGDETAKKLVLTENLKAALLTRCDLTGAQADALLEEARSGEADF